MVCSKEKKNVIGGLAWRFAERISSQGMSFIVSIILARLLMPQEYGVIAIITIFITFANIFVTGGIAQSLIQKKDSDNLDFNSLMFCSMGMSVVLYSIMYVIAPFIADFYNEPQLTKITRVYSLVLFLNGFNCIQQAWVSKHMMFRKFFYSTLSAVIVSGTVGVVMAYMGYGVWALVAQTLTYTIITIIVIKSIIEWRPALQFSWMRAKPLLQFGWKLLASNLFTTLYYQLRQLLIGKYYTSTDLALYDRGKHYPELLTNNIDASISSVLFPAMAKYGNQPDKIKQMTRRAMMTSSYIMFFLLVTLGVCAPPLVRLMLTDKWEGCVPFLQLMCIARGLHTISIANLQAMSAIGRSDLILKLEIIKKPIGILMIAVSVPFGVIWVAATLPLYSVYSAYVNMSPNKKVIGYSYSEQLRDLMPATLLSVFMCALVYPLNYVEVNDWWLICLQLLLCVLIYIGGSIMFKVNSFYYCKNLFMNIIMNKFRK